MVDVGNRHLVDIPTPEISRSPRHEGRCGYAKCCAARLPRQFGVGNMLFLQVIVFPKPWRYV